MSADELLDNSQFLRGQVDDQAGQTFAWGQRTGSLTDDGTRRAVTWADQTGSLTGQTLTWSQQPVSRHAPRWAELINHNQSCDNIVNRNLQRHLYPSNGNMQSHLSLTASSTTRSPAVEKAEIEGSEKVAEINGNGKPMRYDGVRPKEFDKQRIGKHLGHSKYMGRIRKTSSEEKRYNQQVHFSFDSGWVPKKEEKTMMNTSLKLCMGSPKRPSRPTSLALRSHHQQLPNRSCNKSGIPTAEVRPLRHEPVVKDAEEEVKAMDEAQPVRRRENSSRSRRETMKQNRRSCPVGPVKEVVDVSPDTYNSFDVYNLEASIAKIDWEAIENHLEEMKIEERKRRNDRELIRHRLATESVCSGDQETESSPIATDAASSSRNGLHSRLQGGMNLQICFMNETASDYEDEEPQEEQRLHPQRTATASMISPVADGGPLKEDILGKKMVSAQSKESDIERRVWSTSCGPVTPAAEGFQQRQQQLQMEARESLQLAQQLAHWQTRQQRASCTSPTTDVIRTALSKIGVSCSDTRRRASRPILTDMNIAQLQVIVNDIHSRIELLNDELVRCLMERDEAHMDQDSRLVHIEDLTSYFGQKQQRLQDKPQMTPPSARPH